MQVDFVSDPKTIEHEWWELWRRDLVATPFQSPAWLIPWVEQFGGARTGVLVARENGAISALLPVTFHEGRWLLWGAGTSDWLGGVFAPDLELSTITSLFAALDTPLDLFQLRPESLLRLAPPPPGWTDEPRSSAPCLGLALPAALPDNIAQNLRYYRRRAERVGIGAPIRLGSQDFDRLIELHTARWSEAGEPGVLADPKVVAWHRAALPRLEAAGLLRFHGLSQGDRLVGALYALADARAAYYYIGGFDPELSYLGLGTILIGHAVEAATAEGAATFDFLRGQEPYKYRWGALDRPSYARMLTPG